MLIGVRKRFIFVAVTKTGSTAVQAALLDHAEIDHGLSPARKHMRLRHALERFDFLFDQPATARARFFAFGVMREPIDWLQSWYRFRLDPRVRDPIPPDEGFAAFCARAERGDDFNFHLADGRRNLQSDFFVSQQGAVLADYIIPYHTLATHYAHIAHSLGLPATLPVRNRSRRRDRVEVPPDLRRRLQEFYAPDYALFERLDEINAVGAEKLARMARARAP